MKKILSLFDGISCGQLALQRAGVQFDQYYASEIDPHAIKITQHNFPRTIQLGDVTKIKGIENVYLLLAGSPCQGFSSAGKGLNFNDPRSKLFFEFVRILKETKPRFWLLENVVMKKEYENIITEILKTKPVKINSSLVSAQNRVRLYWANFPIELPKDKGIKLKDILENKGLNKAAIIGRRLNQNLKREDYNKDIPITQCLEVSPRNKDKSNCLTTVGKDNVLTTLPPGRYKDVFKNNLPFRYYTIKEYCRLQTIPENYFNGISENQIRKLIGNGWTVDLIAHILKKL